MNVNSTAGAESRAPSTAASPTAAWTPERIRALGTVTTVPTAAAIFGLSRSVAYDLIKTGGVPVPVLRFGGRYRIPVAAILTALHLPVTAPQHAGHDLIDPGESGVDRPDEIRSRITAAPDTR
jgi:hypothetical protein